MTPHSYSAFPTVIAHRGFAHHVPENTIPAFVEAVRMGAEMLELDVYETRDGEFMVHHDASLTRISPSWKHISYEYARSLARDDRLIPRLADTLSYVGKTPVNLHLKYIKHPTRLIALLEQHPLATGSFLSSHHYTILYQVHLLRSGIPLYPVIGAQPRQVIKTKIRKNILNYYVPRFLPHTLGGLSIHHRLISESLVQQLHERSMKIYVWTVNHEDRMQRMIQLQVDGIMTDRLDLLLQIKRAAVR